MATGYFIGVGDKTTCGGQVQEGDNTLTWNGLVHAHEGDRVSCGKDGKIYRISGGFQHFTSNGRRVAGTLHSVSGCPCKAQLCPSVFTATYTVDVSPTPQVRAKSPTAAPPHNAPSPAINRDRVFTNEFAEAEEEEEEVEQEQLITLRLGVFFDGTGNNQSNSESVAGCMARDVGLEEQAEEIQRFCAEHGYGIDGSAPDDSYGNDTTNVGRLYDLYRDQTDESIGPEADEAAIAVYLEGIGTVSGGADHLYAQATGGGKTGVLARVEQTPGLILERMKVFEDNNPDVKVKRLEIDVFGFSRGAAAARHFINDLRKGMHSLLSKAFPVGSSILADGFAWQVGRDIRLNFIGLFDTVPGIVSPLVMDFSPGNDRNPGLNLGLPKGAARKIVQLVARDEHRLNFALIRTDHDIVLPGSHSDIGGGYRPRMRERLLVAKPTSSLEMKTTPNERSVAYSQARSAIGPLVSRLIEQGVELDMHTWSVDVPRTRDNLIPDRKHVYVVTRLDREVDGDLSKIYLRVMREIAVQHRVPLRAIDERDPRLRLPDELKPVHQKLQAYALGQSTDLGLTNEEELLLLRRYIHLSASWNAVKERHNSDVRILFVNRPADGHQRISHGNR
ncbi:MAG TPA: PAAR domain-containing protein [Pseudomonas sp.]|uniref:PAAR domain-containing protein n=1 Tax=Pseudomonas sp. TaxID=306 RepID=UPI002ED7E408